MVRINIECTCRVDKCKRQNPIIWTNKLFHSLDSEQSEEDDISDDVSERVRDENGSETVEETGVDSAQISQETNEEESEEPDDNNDDDDDEVNTVERKKSAKEGHWVVWNDHAIS